jgi:hypothetical protein
MKTSEATFVIVMVVNLVVTVFILGCVYLQFRMAKTARLTRDIIDLVYKYNLKKRSQGKHNEQISVESAIPSYKRMVLSFRPLRPKLWLPKEIVEELKEEQTCSRE